MKTPIDNSDLALHIETRDGLIWTSIFDANGELLNEPITRPLVELTNSHLERIVEFFAENKKLAPNKILMELTLRKIMPEFNIE